MLMEEAARLTCMIESLHIAKCLASQPFLGTMRDGYSSSQWLSAGHVV